MPRVASNVWLTILILLGLTASLLAPGAGPARGAHGDDPDVDYAATYSACVGPALESAGFVDTVGSFAEDAINCLAHYGITTGRTETTYAPGDSVLRWQMALFLARAAVAAGIVLENPASDQGFTDIGGLSEEARNAVNGLARAEIMPGISATAFAPNQAVTRASMAVLLDAFLSKARPGAGAFGPDADRYSEVKSDNNQVFNDISGVTRLANVAIGRIYEAGVTTGIGDHQFGPNGLVTRAQMAAFITRALAHTRARPAGVSVQAAAETLQGAASSVDLLISVRDVAFGPLPDVSVDVFRAAEGSAAFTSDGSCATDNVNGLIGSAKCRIDANDELTDASGDITTLAVEGISSATTVWAWTGEIGDEYGSETVASQATVGFLKAPAKVLITDDLDDNQQTLRFGETVTFRLQVADEDDAPSAESGWRVPIRVSQTEAGTTAVTGYTRTYTTDASGRIELAFTKEGTDAAGDTARVSVQIGNSPAATDDVATKNGVSASLPVVDKTTNKAVETGEDAGRYVVDWSEADSEPTTLALRSARPFTLASDANDGASASVIATLTDQYGGPVRGAGIFFRSDDQQGIGAAGDGLETVLTDTTRLARSAPTGDIVMATSPAELSSDTATVDLTIGFYINDAALYLGSGDFRIDYTIELPLGVTASPETLTGSVTLPAAVTEADDTITRQNQVSVEHPALTLSGLEDAVGRYIAVAGEVGACVGRGGQTGPSKAALCGFTPRSGTTPIAWFRASVQEARISIVEDDELTVVSQDGVQRNVPCGSYSQLGGSDFLSGDVYPARCLVGDQRTDSRRTTNSRGEAMFVYDRDSDEGGLETIWASYVKSGGETLLTDRLYYPWVEEPEGKVSGRILRADADNDQVVIYPGLGLSPQLVDYDANDQLSSLDGPDTYANFDKHLGRDADSGPPGYLTVGSYSSTARGVSKVSLGGAYSFQPPAAVAQWMDETSDLAASENGVIVIGNSSERKVYVFDGIGDRTPQTLTSDSSTGEYGWDVAVSANGSTIVVSDPQYLEWRRAGTPPNDFEVIAGRVYVYTRSFDESGFDGEFALAATLNNGYYGEHSSYFGAGLDISGDGNTIAVASPAAGVSLGTCIDIFLPDCIIYVEDFGIGYVQLFFKPAAGWGAGGTPNLVQPPTEMNSAALGTLDYTGSVGNHRAVSVSYDGSVVVAGDTNRGAAYEDDQGDEVVVEEAGGVFLWERPKEGWDRTRSGYNPAYVLTLDEDDMEWFGWIGPGARVSGDGSAVVVSGNHPQVGDPKPELYVFSKPDTGWRHGAPYDTLTVSDLAEGETFGASVDINWDGKEVIADRHLVAAGDYRGAVQVFAKTGSAWRAGGGLPGDPGDGFGRYATYAGGNSVAAADRFGGEVTLITR